MVNALNNLPENEDVIIGIAKLLEFNQTATDTILQQLIKSDQNIVLASYMKNGELVKPHPFFSQEATVGFIDYEALAENRMVEKSFLQKTFNGKTANHFSLELAKKSQKYDESILLVEEPKIINFIGDINFEDERMPSFLSIEESELGRGEVSTFDGKILIIEEFDSYTYYYEDLPMDTSNLFSTPYTNYSLANFTPSKMSQATIVANQVDMILNDRFIDELSLSQRSILYVATLGFFLFLFVQMNRVRFLREGFLADFHALCFCNFIPDSSLF